MGKSNQALCAMVIFRSMEGVQRSKKALGISGFKKFLFRICCCCFSSKYARIQFKNRFLNLKPAVDPELLLWQNFGVSKKQRCMRIIIFVIFVLGILSLCFYSILFLEYTIQDSEAKLPGYDCSGDVLITQASTDYFNDLENRNGDFVCFCENLYNKEGYYGLENKIFPISGLPRCLEWYSLSQKIALITTFVPLVMGIINVLSEILIGFASQFTRPVNETKNIIDSIAGICSIQFINLGMLLIFVSINYELNIIGISNPPGIQFTDFTSPWYNKVGAQVILSMLIEIVAPHALPLIMIIFLGIRRCCDRGCTNNKRRTKQLIQSSYEHMYIGPEFMLDSRLAQLVAITWVTFMFSTGLPVIILVTLCNFLAMYWIDKYLLLRFYRTPKNWDDTTINYSFFLLKFTFLFHMLMGMLMLSNTNILTSEMVLTK